MSRLAISLLLLASFAFGATTRLYLKDGDYQLVREYQVLSDRVRYYSTERSQWEEIPLELVDLDRTKKEAAQIEAEIEADAKAQDAEDAAIHAAKKQAASVPEEPGVYYINGEKLDKIPFAEVDVVNSKARTVLKILTPVPIVPGKTTVELKGEAAQFRVNNNQPEFYFRLSDYERFGIVKAQKKKNGRLVENVAILPQSDEILVDLKLVDTFKKQEGDMLYKIWPEKPLDPGEYALVEYTEDQINIQVWDFGVGPAK
jgi:hypothetical protein